MIIFTEDLKTFVPEIDKQHKELIDLLNNLVAMGPRLQDKEAAEEALEFLGNYIAKHFNEEEKLMAETGYTKLDWHLNWHAGYIKKYEGLVEEYENNGPSGEFTQILNDFIIKWIIRHIQNVDVELGKHITAYFKANPRRK